MGNPVTGGLFFVRARLNRLTPGQGKYGDFTFHFRGYDLPILREFFLANEYEFLAPALKERTRPVVVDVGAHIGLFSLWALSINPDCRILSIEASPGTFSLLKKNRAALPVNHTYNWAVINRAAWENGHPVRFSTAGNSMSHCIAEEGETEIHGVTLLHLVDMAAPDGGLVHIMKIDVEGAEEKFLCSCPDALDRVERLAIELHHERCDTARVRALLEEKFVKITDMSGRFSPKPLLYCEK